MAKTVSVTLSDKQYEWVKKEAEKEKISTSQFVKTHSIVDDEFETRYEYLREQALKQEINKPFTVMSLFPDWFDIDLGTRLSLGRNFYHLVKRGDKNIEPFGKNSSNIQLYVRKEKEND